MIHKRVQFILKQILGDSVTVFVFDEEDLTLYTVQFNRDYTLAFEDMQAISGKLGTRDINFAYEKEVYDGDWTPDESRLLMEIVIKK